MFKKIDELIPEKLKKHIPNTITVGRLFMTMGFVSSFLSGNMPMSVALFASASFSDAIDGYLARKWKVQSKFGKYVDPFADKLLVGSALLLYGTVNPLMYITLIGELSIACINILSVIKKKNVNVNKEGKIKTILLMTTISLGLLSTLFNNSTFNKIISALALLNIPFQSTTFMKYFSTYYENDNKIENKDTIIKEHYLDTNNNEKDIKITRSIQLEKLKKERENLTKESNIEINKQKIYKKDNNNPK